MRTRICEMFGIELPIFAFTNSPGVCAEVSLAGGMGVFGALPYSADELEAHLRWIDKSIQGKPYGVDLAMPMSYAGADQGDLDKADLEKMIPEKHRRFIDGLMGRYKVPPLPDGESPFESLLSWTRGLARLQVDVALSHPIRLLVSALGPPPEDVVAEAQRLDVRVAALAGSVRHARMQVEAGVDVVIAQGTEAGGHTGTVSTMVLVPEVVDAVKPKPVLAAGGIGCGRQVAAALALGADGVWTGSIWLTARENQVVTPALKEKLLRATSKDTVRSRSLSGKPARMLRTPWTDAWEAADSPGTLPLPLQWMATVDAVSRIYRYAESGMSGPRELLGTPVGQIVGKMNEIRSTREIFRRLAEETAEALRRMREGD